MTDRHAFLQAIKDHPDDDTPRLVFADWLDEHGEPERAMLIRQQCEIGGRNTFPPGYAAGYQCHRWPEGDWKPEVLAVVIAPPVRDVSYSVDRGILVAVETTWAAWAEHGDRLYEAERPWRVRLTTVPDVGWEPAAGTGPGSGQMIWLATATGGYFGDPAWFASSENPYPALLAARWPGTQFELSDSPDVRFRPPCPR